MNSKWLCSFRYLSIALAVATCQTVENSEIQDGSEAREFPDDLVDRVETASAIYEVEVKEVGAIQGDIPENPLDGAENLWRNPDKLAVVQITREVVNNSNVSLLNTDVNLTTARLTESPRLNRLNRGERVFIFTEPGYFSQYIGVVATAPHLPANLYPGAADKILNLRSYLDDRSLHVRIRQSEMVSVAKVIEIVDRSGPPFAESNPLWHTAKIRISQQLGNPSELEEAEIWFAASTSRRWHLAPKFSVGEEAIILLTKTDSMGIAGLPAGVLVSSFPGSKRHVNEKDRIRSLYLNPPEEP